MARSTEQLLRDLDALRQENARLTALESELALAIDSLRESEDSVPRMRTPLERRATDIVSTCDRHVGRLGTLAHRSAVLVALDPKIRRALPCIRFPLSPPFAVSWIGIGGANSTRVPRRRAGGGDEKSTLPPGAAERQAVAQPMTPPVPALSDSMKASRSARSTSKRRRVFR